MELKPLLKTQIRKGNWNTAQKLKTLKTKET